MKTQLLKMKHVYRHSGKKTMKMFWHRVVCTSLVLNVMNHAVLITSYVVVRAVRVTLVFRVSICRLKMT